MAVDKKPFARLPKSVKPVLYDLFLKPDLQNFTFEGKETVSINVSIIELYYNIIYIFNLISCFISLTYVDNNMIYYNYHTAYAT